jgi:hypothetical protein
MRGFMQSISPGRLGSGGQRGKSKNRVSRCESLVSQSLVILARQIASAEENRIWEGYMWVQVEVRGDVGRLRQSDIALTKVGMAHFLLSHSRTTSQIFLCFNHVHGNVLVLFEKIRTVFF